MEVILKEDVHKLGSRGDVVKVAEGYGRNFLLPRKLAIEANAGNKAVIVQMKAAAVRRSANLYSLLSARIRSTEASMRAGESRPARAASSRAVWMRRCVSSVWQASRQSAPASTAVIAASSTPKCFAMPSTTTQCMRL